MPTIMTGIIQKMSLKDLSFVAFVPRTAVVETFVPLSIEANI